MYVFGRSRSVLVTNSVASLLSIYLGLDYGVGMMVIGDNNFHMWEVAAYVHTSISGVTSMQVKLTFTSMEVHDTLVELN